MQLCNYLCKILKILSTLFFPYLFIMPFNTPETVSYAVFSACQVRRQALQEEIDRESGKTKVCSPKAEQVGMN